MMESNPVLSKLFPGRPGSQDLQQIPRGQYGNQLPPALLPHAGLPQGVPFTNVLPIHMLRCNHSAHVNRTAHSTNEQSNDLELQLLHPELRHLLPPSEPSRPHQEVIKRKERNQQRKSRNSRHRTNNGPQSSASAPTTLSETVVSSTKVPGGGRIVSSRDESGHMRVRIVYDRSELLRFAHSPYAVLPPPCLKDIAMNHPEILSGFPERHGVDLSPPCELE
ncbi:hypothetical protein KIN20_022681 [Parelaphostrongylus tenuis]|uniref:Uncharacterized protein n=1 Tax=Parelaphostrongylus tenuis TaxID=148309 RepID=A0AAD5QWY2_PARTN|nr:hypothetical protein KIN20_022681 [Parelaphostrongylus tenuis]